MDLNIRHHAQPINSPGITNTTKLKTISLFTLFIVQFLLSQFVLSYGIYAIYFKQQTVTILDALWPPIFYITTTKVSSPWLQVISESLYEHNSRSLFFIGTIFCSTGVAICYFYVQNIIICGVFYGIIAGLGSSLILSLVNCHLYDIFPYETHFVLGIHHLGIACGLFATPHIIKLLYDFSSISYVFLIHGAMLLHILPAGLLLGKKKMSRQQRLTTYNNLGTNEFYEEEMVEMSHNEYNLSLLSRNWKSPSDNVQQENEIDELDNSSTEKIFSPVLTHKTNAGVNILPQIMEEDENETDDELNNKSKRNSTLLDNNLKRMSVISIKLEEIIQKEEERTILELKRNEENKKEVILIPSLNDEAINNISLSIDKNLNRQNKNCCCTPYQKYRFRRRFKSFFYFIYKLFLKPIVKSCQVVEFYPSLLTNVHSLLSPLIFLNLVVFRASSLQKEINLTELSFMFSIIAFSYLVFLITLPWITEISKRNLKYVYILGCFTSASSIYICSKTDSNDYIIISCLMYGLGFGIESYLKQTVLKEFLGISKWSKTENTLECFSGILLVVMIIILKNYLGTENENDILYYTEQWLDVIFCNHLIVCLIWIVFPLIHYLFDMLFYRNRGKYNFT